jgi:hypothetical protein
MSALSETSPQDPLYYAPRRLRDRAAPPLSSFDEAQSAREAAPGGRPIRTSLDTSLENAVYQSLRRPLEPEFMNEPSAMARGMDRRKVLYGGAAVGISALAALFFVLMVREPDVGAYVAAAVQSIKAAQPKQSETGAASAPSEFRGLAASTEASPSSTPEQSEKLLQRFKQWRERTGVAGTSQ